MGITLWSSDIWPWWYDLDIVSFWWWCIHPSLVFVLMNIVNLSIWVSQTYNFLYHVHILHGNTTYDVRVSFQCIMDQNASCCAHWFDSAKSYYAMSLSRKKWYEIKQKCVAVRVRMPYRCQEVPVWNRRLKISLRWNVGFLTSVQVVAIARILNHRMLV